MYLESFGPGTFDVATERLRKFMLNGELMSFNRFNSYNLPTNLFALAINMQTEELYLAYLQHSVTKINEVEIGW